MRREAKVARLIFMLALCTIGVVFGLNLFNFHGPSHAAASTPPPSPAIAVPSINPNAPISYADSVALAAPAVVSIKTTKEMPLDQNPLMQDPFFRHFFGDPNTYGYRDDSRDPRGNAQELPKEVLQGLGSGVIVSDKGYILTNNHVIRDTDTVVVTLADGRTSDAKVIGTDPDTDLAVLQVKLDKLPVIPMGSSAKLRAGDVVLAIGNPFGLAKTVTSGIVSATERPGSDIGILENLIQTDAAINPGNSGGALIDAYGHLVGINTVIYSRTGGYQGIGFAIPIDQASDVMKVLIEGKHISRGYLGVSLQPLNKEIRDSTNYKDEDGVYVRAIVRGSPAQKAGLYPSDIITKINNVVIKDDRMAVSTVAGLKPGQAYTVDIFRKGDHMTFTVTLDERKTAQATGKTTPETP